MHILVALQTAFSLWMLADAYQRKAGTHWYFIVLIPFGEWVYFFMVKIHDPEIQKVKKKLLTKPTSLSDLRYQAESTPSSHNKLLFAQALHDHQEYADAIALFQEVLAKSAGDKSALHGIAVCHIKKENFKQAIPYLEDLVNLDLSYDNYAAVADLATAKWETGEKQQAVELLQSISKKSQQLSIKTELARYLCEISEPEPAKELLENALLAYQNSPSYIKKSERAWAKQARRLLKTL